MKIQPDPETLDVARGMNLRALRTRLKETELGLQPTGLHPERRARLEARRAALRLVIHEKEKLSVERLVEYMRAPERLAELLPGKNNEGLRAQYRSALRKGLMPDWAVAGVAERIDPKLTDQRSRGTLRAATYKALHEYDVVFVREQNPDEYSTENGCGWVFKEGR